MESSGECTSPYTDASPSFMAMLQEVEPRVARRRLSQARHRAKLAGLFNHLRDTVYAQSAGVTQRWQVLRKAKNYIMDLERKLENLLILKEKYHLKDDQPLSLEEVKEEYIGYYKDHSIFSSCSCLHSDTASNALPAKTKVTLWQWLRDYRGHPTENDVKSVCSQSPVKSSTELLEFEGYLNFYKETVDLLVENRIVSMEQITLPVVSKAISHLWQQMSMEGKAAIFKKCSQRVCFSPSEQLTLQIPLQIDHAARDRILDSQGASASSESNQDEVRLLKQTSFHIEKVLIHLENFLLFMLFEDAFDLASGFLVKPELDTLTEIKEESRYQTHKTVLAAECSSADDCLCFPFDWITSPVFTHSSCENPEETCLLYKQIVNFVLARSGSIALHSQQSSPNLDDETVLLRCTETFDDDL
ncbi:stimulated by retinoic acid gene 8 protein homolog [Leucoraja erinacea]|uniref:stimulated by retinoic acid gene 8 protein homolog n=1 Tax=Leucoraja erinaceus TaxID=7782 RepID=UPI002457BED5|nr:stimulated by retinoic acid gene 8 protein homolog [Leucoraja erinacea]